MKWWEKTVEYNFVIKATREDIFDLLLPLDGDVESIGDAVICKDAVYFIIEFKKSLHDLSSEYSKFVDEGLGFLHAALIMSSNESSTAHFLVGGAFVDGCLNIEIKHYFDIEGKPTTDLKSMLVNGLSREALEVYTKEYTALKKAECSDDSSGSTGGGFTYQNVLAVSKYDKKASIVPLHYFNAPALRNELKNSNTVGREQTLSNTSVAERTWRPGGP